MQKKRRMNQLLPGPHQRRQRSTLIGHRIAPTSLARTPSTNNVHPQPEPSPPPPTQPSEDEMRRQAELEKDLQLARDIQQGLLLAAVPYLPGWEFSATSLPARELGGDLYDFLPLSNGQQAIMIGDVSGKGLAAALRMAVTRTVFRHEARSGGASASTLAAVNRGVCTDIPHGMVTMLYARLNPLQGILQVANAGHTYPLLFNETVREFEMPGLPLGVDPDVDYDEETIQIAPGDSLFLYTDGVNEATSKEEEEFGYERLHNLLVSSNQMRPRTIMRRILHTLRTWSAGMPQSDDITMVVLRRRFSRLNDELRVIANDVLGMERAPDFWDAIEIRLPCPPAETTADIWMELLPEVVNDAKTHFGRGLARELNQELRLTIEEYKT